MEGPFTIEGLKNKGLQKHTQVWFEGLPQWVSAEKLPELNSYVTGDELPPPFYEMEVPTLEDDDSFYAKRPRNLILTLILIIVAIVVLLWILNYHNSKPSSKDGSIGQELQDSIEQPAWLAAQSGLRLKNSSALPE